jgi:predicted NBD/HSP70 family sugar kinase
LRSDSKVLNGEVHRGSAWIAGGMGYMLVRGANEAPVESNEPGPLESAAGGEGIKSMWKSRWSAALNSLSKEAAPTEIFDHALKGNAMRAVLYQRRAQVQPLLIPRGRGRTLS